MIARLRRTRAVLATSLALLLVAGVVVAMRSSDVAERLSMTAYFDNSNGLFAGDDVRIRGVPVGKVEKIEPQPQQAKVWMWIDRKYKVPADAKAVIVDDALAIVGSANMDMRSLFLNYEVALFLYACTQVDEIAAWARSLMADARVGLPRESWAGELAENVVRLLSPLL